MIERRIPPSLRRRIEVEDILQSAYIKLDRSLASEDPGSDEVLRTWIFRSVLNEWHDQRRWHEARCRAVALEEPLPDGSVGMLLERMGVSTRCGLVETIERIRKAVKPAAFEIVLMHAGDGLSHKEIAAIVGKTEGAVGRCYIRALETIRAAVSSPFPSSS